MKVAVGFISMVVIAVGGAIALIVWISGMAPIQATESETLPGTPPSPAALVEQGAVLVARGEVQEVHDPEWTTDDGSRPNTPWEISSVPDEHWIQTPVTISLEDDPLVLRPETAAAVEFDDSTEVLAVAVRGGEIDEDVYEIDDGQDRDFEPGERVLLVLTVVDSDLDEPELAPTTPGPAWDLMRRYDVGPDDTAVLTWGEETYERPVDEVLEDFHEATR